jgi:hypothetical protein
VPTLNKTKQRSQRKSLMDATQGSRKKKKKNKLNAQVSRWKEIVKLRADQEDINHFNRFIAINEIDTELRRLPAKKSLGLNGVTVEFS